MKRIRFIVISLFFVLTMHLVSYAGVNVTVGIPAPLIFAAPPDLVVVPSGDADVYMVPDAPGLYFYDNYWYRFYGDRWYRSNVYDGSWVYIEPNFVPGYIIDLPPDYYRRLPRGYHRIHYRDFHTHWRSWHHDRHWNRYDWYKRQHREHERWRRDHPRPHRDLGRRDGRRDGRFDGKRDGRLDGRRDGRLDGKRDGRLDGKRDGRLDGKRSDGEKRTHPDDRRGMGDR